METEHAVALAVWLMVTERAGKNCAGGLGYGAGLGYSNRICNAFICPQKKEGHVVKFTFTASVCGCAYEWVCMLARAACDWLGLVSEKVAQHIDNHVVLFMSLQSKCG